MCRGWLRQGHRDLGCPGEMYLRVREVGAPEYSRDETQNLCPSYLLAPHHVEYAIVEAGLRCDPKTSPVGCPECHRDENGSDRDLLPSPSFKRASWHLMPHRSRTADHRYAPNPPRGSGAAATPAATSASNPIPSPLLNRIPFTSPVSTLLKLTPAKKSN